MLKQIKEKITRRRRQILVHSCVYYRLNSNLISDSQFDEWANELVALQRKYPNIASTCEYAKAFSDYTGATGYHLPIGDSWVISTAQRLLKNSRRD